MYRAAPLGTAPFKYSRKSAVVSRTIFPGGRQARGLGLGLVAGGGRRRREESGCTVIGTKFRRVAVHHSALLFFPTPEWNDGDFMVTMRRRRPPIGSIGFRFPSSPLAALKNLTLGGWQPQSTQRTNDSFVAKLIRYTRYIHDIYTATRDSANERTSSQIHKPTVKIHRCVLPAGGSVPPRFPLILTVWPFGRLSGSGFSQCG